MMCVQRMWEVGSGKWEIGKKGREGMEEKVTNRQEEEEEEEEEGEESGFEWTPSFRPK